VNQDEEFRRRCGSRLIVSKVQHLNYNKATVEAAVTISVVQRLVAGY